MSPIRPENRDRYPKDWREISRRIRFERALGGCECEGECGMPGHMEVIRGGVVRCLNSYGEPSIYGTEGKTVILTVAHLDHTPENCDDENLRAMCQGCHLWYDREHHAETRRATREARLAAAGAVPLDSLDGKGSA